ncbi:hypothetical protein [Castellaniella sp. S9]|uniref:hypothetical protein n=1 Tax=Castellaniella sp. S9 TaxID=2993652 RepID=UPI0022B2E58B|nr:hypothetical protein [Castellaniella sp. S9]
MSKSNPGHFEETTMGHHDDDEDEKVPLIQQLLDSPFLLLFLGVMIPMVVYNLWGFIDILTIPAAK